MAKVKPNGETESEQAEDQLDHGMIAAAEDILSAIALKDATALAKALTSAMQMCPMDDEASEMEEAI